MKYIDSKLAEFNFLSLDDLNKIQLLNRKDTKFVFNQIDLQDILNKLKSSYHILKINDECRFTYKNTYFDTDDFLFYNQHHNEKRNRFKVRFRKYSATNDCFFEIKTKNNKNRTIKIRRKVLDGIEKLGESEKQLISETIKLSSKFLTPQLIVNFSRITLADKNLNERLTIDTNLSVKNGVTSKIFNQLVISEIKQNRYNPKSKFIQILRELKIPEIRFSKYCMGMLHVNKKIKYNRFKPKLMQINKILNQE